MVLSLDRWVGKVAIVTGASSGIGAATAESLVEEGVIVVGLARRKEKVEELSQKLKGKKGKLYAFQTDVGKEQDILNAFKWTKENVGPVSILVNNAATFLLGGPVSGKTEDWKAILDVNVIGLSVATREAIKIMRENNIDGHIIHINSVGGQKVIPGIYALYGPSKFAVRALAETLRLELNSLKSKIKITNLSPGAVKTPMLEEAIQNANLDIMAQLQPKDIADGVLYVLSTPPHVQIQELTIKPVGELI